MPAIDEGRGDAPRRSREREQYSGLCSSSTAALLVITDDPEVRDLLMELAIEEGWGVRAVETEGEAAVAIQTERPGLVMVDLDMESRAGGKFLRTLQRVRTRSREGDRARGGDGRRGTTRSSWSTTRP